MREQLIERGLVGCDAVWQVLETGWGARGDLCSTDHLLSLSGLIAGLRTR